MKKPTLRDARERQRRLENREMILHAAEKVILRKGFGATSMDDVAREAEFSKATLYHYFQSKAELIFEILIHFLEDLERGLAGIEARAGSAKDKLSESVRLAFRFYADKENISKVFMADHSFLKLMRAFISEGSKGTSEAERKFVQKIKAKRKMINVRVKSILREGIVSGEFREIHVDTAVTFLGAVIQGYFQEKLWSETQPDIGKDIDEIEQFILRGIEFCEGMPKGESS